MQVSSPTQIASNAIEKHLGDMGLTEEDTYKTAYDCAFVLAHSALMDAGLSSSAASWVAGEEAAKVAASFS